MRKYNGSKIDYNFKSNKLQLIVFLVYHLTQRNTLTNNLIPFQYNDITGNCEFEKLRQVVVHQQLLLCICNSCHDL